MKCGWERKRSCLGRVGVRISSVIRLPQSPPLWLLTRPARPLRTHHTPYLSHTPRLLPSPRRWYPLLQALWNPCLTLAQAAPPLTRFSRTLSWRVLQKRATLMDGLVCLARVPL